MRAAFEVGAGKVKDNVVGAFKNLTGGKGRKKGGGGQKPTVIIEYVDVGVPVRTAYLLSGPSTRIFSTFAKGVKSAEPRGRHLVRLATEGLLVQPQLEGEDHRAGARRPDHLIVGGCQGHHEGCRQLPQARRTVSPA